MSVELPPDGTRGVVVPRLARPLAKAGMGLSHRIFRILGDRMRVQGQPLLMLTTVGAKTNARRQTVLARFTDPSHPNAWLVVGSGAGSARHPSWCYNLAKNPGQVLITVDKQEMKVRPESLKGTERDEAWKRIVSLAPAYGRYEQTTDRHIPIIRLIPDA